MHFLCLNKKNKAKKFVKILAIFLIFFSLILSGYLILKNSEIFKKLCNLQELKKLIKSAGFWSYSVFALLQFLQVTLLPLPASITTIAGVIIFGPFVTFLISCLSIILGSICAYLCGKILGIKFLKFLLGDKKTKNFQNIFKNSQIIFFIMMLFPFFPDDILCITAGVTNMNFRFFLITNIITRTIGLFTLCFLGSGQIIPFSSWGIPVWIFIAITTLLIFIIYIKNKEKIVDFIKRKLKIKF